MKKLTVLFMLLSAVCAAQKRPIVGDIRYKINAAITKNMDHDLLVNTPEGKVYVFSITLSFDEWGHIDTAYFSKNPKKYVSDVMGLNAKLVKSIKSMNLEYKAYASKLLLIPFLWYNQSDKAIAHYDGFLESFENLFPTMNHEILKKGLIALDPMINPFGKPIR